jgi:hypothetical protein
MRIESGSKVVPRWFQGGSKVVPRWFQGGSGANLGEGSVSFNNAK